MCIMKREEKQRRIPIKEKKGNTPIEIKLSSLHSLDLLIYVSYLFAH